MTTKTDLTKFYELVEKFKDDIIYILKTIHKEDEVKRINIHYDKLLMGKKISARRIVEYVYHKGIEPCARHILTKNEEFFLGHVDKVDTGEHIEERDVMLINHVAVMWPFLDVNIKNNIWKYIQILSILSEKISGGNVLSKMRDELVAEGIKLT